MMTPLMAARAMAGNQPARAQGMVLALVSAIVSTVSGFGSLLAAWAAADAVAAELKSGTVMAIMARPVRRWEFLIGKYLGVQMMMAVYVILMFGLSNLLTGLGGERLVTNPWVLLVYPMIRYGIYSAMAICLVTVMHPILAFVIVMISSVIANMVVPSSLGLQSLPFWLRRGLFFVLPSVNLLSESKFLAITSASLKQTPWTQHLTAIAYGLDYALLWLLLAASAFRRRSLSRE
jgi:ABC-type transport system involved in multi-copper enzyme maturation permease subunit